MTIHAETRELRHQAKGNSPPKVINPVSLLWCLLSPHKNKDEFLHSKKLIIESKAEAALPQRVFWGFCCCCFAPYPPANCNFPYVSQLEPPTCHFQDKPCSIPTTDLSVINKYLLVEC